MKWVVAICLLSMAFYANALTINTLDGRTYYDAQIEERDAAGIHITHSAGACYLPYSNLPKSIRDANNYDPEAAAEFIAQQKAEKKPQAAKTRAPALKRQKEEQAQEDTTKRTSALAKEPVPAPAPIITESERTTGERDYASVDYSSRSYSTGRVYVRAYHRKDGTYVRAHTRRK